MGAVYGSSEDYGLGLALLSGVAAVTLVFTLTAVRRTQDLARRQHA